MDSITFKEFKKRAQHSVKVNQMLRDGTFWNDKALVDEMMDDSPLQEEDGYFAHKHVRIGPNYQANIPELGIKGRLRKK